MMEEHFYDHLVLKGKRTKRQRPMSPLVLTMATTTTTTTSSCSNGGAGDGGGFCDLNLSYGGGADHFTAVDASPSDSSDETIQSKEDEQDMANCLILLAQGRQHRHHHTNYTTTGSDGIITIPDVYECKTCNRRFHSFQALGGHRASHRKPKLTTTTTLSEDHIKKHQPENNTSQLSRGGKDSSCNNNKTRVHECLICGAEFSSGQALGGHMRRHRPLPVAGASSSTTTTTHMDDSRQQVKKSRIEVLGLDLNLPAPEDDHPRGSLFSFATSQLVHCHY